MNLHVHIDRIVIDAGMATEDQTGVVQAAIHEALARLLAGRGLSPALARSGSILVLAAGEIAPSPGSAPRALGAGVGRAVHAALATYPSTYNPARP